MNHSPWGPLCADVPVLGGGGPVPLPAVLEPVADLCGREARGLGQVALAGRVGVGVLEVPLPEQAARPLLVGGGTGTEGEHDVGRPARGSWGGSSNSDSSTSKLTCNFFHFFGLEDRLLLTLAHIKIKVHRTTAHTYRYTYKKCYIK